MKQNKIISTVLMTLGAGIMLTSVTGVTSTSVLTGVLVFSAGSIGLILNKYKEDNTVDKQ